MTYRLQTLLLSLVAISPLHAEKSFNFDIRPILSKNCIGCHGADDKHRGGNFRIDIFEEATKERDGVTGIVPGDPSKSEVFKRITSTDKDYVMPQPDHGHALDPKDIATIKQWITEGAKYEKHWAFEKPKKPAVPQTKYSAWAKTDIDKFIGAELEKQQLEPSHPATPHELIRRVSIDLTGFPPTPEAVEDFVKNPSPENYEKHVDQLLASDSYGENMAASWLDLARYADSVGYSGDEHRDIWPWRDWVIDAFNKNLSYDQFAIEQIAGDLLPNATADQKLATAFHRNTVANNEGGTDDEEYRVIAVKDRMSTTVNVWMGLTMRCAECHTHKYDPISHEEYYQFYDFFNQTVDADNADDRPKLEVFPRGHEKEKEALKKQIAELETKRSQFPDPWFTPKPTVVSRDGSTLTVLEDNSIEATGKTPEFDLYSTTFTAPKGKITGIRIELLPSKNNAGNIGRSADGAVVITQGKLFKGSADTGEQLKFSDVVADHEQANYEVKHIIRDVEDGKGWVVNHDREGYSSRREAVFTLATPLDLKADTQLTFTMDHKSPWATQNTARYRISYTMADEPVKKYRENTLDPNERLIRDLAKRASQSIRVPVLQERNEQIGETRRESNVHIRGSFRQLGEKVTAAVPSAFNPMPADAPKNRLGVAHWIVSKDNPLTARVAVNRFWSHIFGIGIVETEEDFGMQSLLPSHPELLDYLAVDFMENGWDLKKLLKSYVMTAAYQQSSRATDAHLAKDNRNLYLARGPRTRLTAEQVRDQALAVSGLLTEKVFGPPVYPPSPVKFIASAFTGGMKWVENTDADRYRRAIYTYLKRSSPHPLFDTFDMATRDVCSMRRFRTNTPLQSFMTLNDPVFIEASQSLARKMVEKSAEPAEAIRFGLERALCRTATTDQVDTLKQLYDETLAQYQGDLVNAKKMAGDQKIPATLQVTDANAAQLAAMSVVANTILNLDALITK